MQTMSKLDILCELNRENMEFYHYLEKRIAHGKNYFTIDDAVKELGKSKNAIRLSISHLMAKNEIVSPAKGFYLMVPPEYRVIGCIPADQFIPYLMECLGHKYYVGLITAASYYGASHQASQIFQVITEHQLRRITCGKVKIQFIKNMQLKDVPTNMVSTPKSRLIISTPESTAMDLLRFIKQSGGLNNIVTLLSDLKEQISEDKLGLILESQPELAWKQRLGYIFEFIGAKNLADVIENHLSKQKRIDYILLNPNIKKFTKKKKNETWKIIENVKIESDI